MPVRARECRARHGRARRVALPCAREDEDEPRHGADDDRVDEGARHGDQPLLGGLLRLCRRRGNRRGAETGLIGEDAARDTVLHRHHDRGARKAARCRRAGECPVEDQTDRRGDAVDVHHDDADTDDYVENRHKGNDARGHLGNAPKAADGDRRDQHREGDIRHETRHAEGELCRVYNGVDLRECPDAEEGNEHRRTREKSCERAIFLPHAVTDVVHRAAGNVAALVGRAVLHGEQALRVLRRHAEERCHPHPEDCPRAADLDRRRDTDDIARADGRGERDAKCLKARHVALPAVFRAQDERERTRQAAHLEQREPQRQHDARPHEQDDERCPPEEGIHRVQYGKKRFHTRSLRK